MQKMGILHLSAKNVLRKPIRSIGLLALVALFCFALLAGSLVAYSLSQGVATLANRMGADVMVVPAGHEAKIASVLLRGSSSSIYLPSDALQRMSDVDGIAAMSPQLYVSVDDEASSDSAQQVVGIDAQSDFLISAWLTEQSDFSALTDKACIVGSKVDGAIGQTKTIRGKTFQIIGRLEQTGMSFDSTIFVDINAARAMLSTKMAGRPQVEQQNLASALMIKLQSGFNSQIVARQISQMHADDGLFGMFSKKFVNSISSNLQVIMRFVKFAIVAIWLLASVVLGLVFSMIIRERKKEMATLRIIGMRRKQLNQLLMSEFALISLFGATLGAVASYCFLFFYGATLADKMSIPFLLPSTVYLILWGVVCFVAGALIAPLAALYPIRKMMKADVYAQYRADE